MTILAGSHNQISIQAVQPEINANVELSTVIEEGKEGSGSSGDD